MKRVWRCIRIVSFFVALGLLVFLFNATMIPKRPDGITPVKALYEQEPNTVDALIVGSSHAGMNLSTQVLWDEYGIASFNIWGSVQPFWNSFYNIIEAFKSQTPKVVILEVYAATFDFEYSDDARQVANVEGMRWSQNKWEAIKASAPKERWAQLVTLLPLVHDRYDELTETDFHYYPWSDLVQDKGGLDIRYGIAGNIPFLDDANQITDVAPLHEKEELYLRKIIDLCKQKEVPLLLLSSPVVPRLYEQPFYNRVAEIARENDVPYLNCNLLDNETQLDCTHDFFLDGSHLNTIGAKKITRYLGNYLKTNFDLPDRRGLEGFESWEASSHAKEREYLPQITDSQDYLSELATQRYLYYIVKNSGWEISDNYRALEQQFARIGVGLEVMEGGGGTWTLDTSVEDSVPLNQFDGNMKNVCTASGVEFSADFETTGEVCVNGEIVYHLRGAGIILVVYDLYTQKCVDVTDYLEGNNFALARP